MEVRFRDYALKKKIGSGSFADIWLAEKINDSKQKVAIKLEPYEKGSNFKDVYKETKILESLAKKVGFPKLYQCGIEDEFFVMAFELLGPTLEDLLSYCGGRFGLKTTLLLADQMLDRIMDLHSINLLHRDIKPENYCIGIESNKDTIYMIDFGLSKRFSDPRTGLHIKYQNSKGLTGTARYVSINSHLGLEQSRRDDLESLGYMLIYFMSGSLPWQDQRADNKAEKFKKIMESKLNTPIDELCRGFPDEFKTYMNYCRNLRFEEEPDYIWIKNLFRNLYFKEYEAWDNIFDWNKLHNSFLTQDLDNFEDGLD